MSDTMLDDSESMEYWGGDEGAEYDIDSEDYDDSAEYYGDLGEAESPEARRRRLARQRRQRLATRYRRRALQKTRQQRPGRAVRPRPTTAAAAVRRTQAKVQEVDLESKVQADLLRGRVDSLARSTEGANYGLAINAVASHLKDELDNFREDLGEQTVNALQDVANYAQIAGVRSQRRGLASPPVMAAAAGLLIAGGSFLFRRSGAGGGNDGDGIITDRAPTVPVGGKLQLQTKGSGVVTFTSDNDTVAAFDAPGVVTGKKAGVANITATRGTTSDTVPLTVIQPAGGGK